MLLELTHFLKNYPSEPVCSIVKILQVSRLCTFAQKDVNFQIRNHRVRPDLKSTFLRSTDKQ